MAKPEQTIRLYSFPLSGHGHRVEMMLSMLQLPYEVINVDLPKGEQRSEEFVKINPMSQVPVLQDGDITLPDSNAILVYLVGKYGDSSWLPTDPVNAAKVQRFLSLAAGEIMRGPAAARLIHLFKAPLDLAFAQTVAKRVLTMLNGHLANQEYMVGQERTIADIACYTYIKHAPEGGISLDDYPNLQAWLARIEALPGFVAMKAMPVPAQAAAA